MIDVEKMGKGGYYPFQGINTRITTERAREVLTAKVENLLRDCQQPVDANRINNRSLLVLVGKSLVAEVIGMKVGDPNGHTYECEGVLPPEELQKVGFEVMKSYGLNTDQSVVVFDEPLRPGKPKDFWRERRLYPSLTHPIAFRQETDYLLTPEGTRDVRLVHWAVIDPRNFPDNKSLLELQQRLQPGVAFLWEWSHLI